MSGWIIVFKTVTDKLCLLLQYSALFNAQLIVQMFSTVHGSRDLLFTVFPGEGSAAVSV